MPANYYLSDLQPLLPFVPINDDSPFPWQAGDGHVLYMADDLGLWLRVPDDNIISAAEFETITGFRRDELGRKKAGSFYIYTLNDGAPLLPFPFTAAQLQEFEKRARIFSSNSRYYGDGTDELIAEIAQSNPKAAELARAVVYGELLPEPTAMPAPVGAAGASSDVETEKAGPMVNVGVQGNSTKTRRSDSIDPVIKLAQAKCRDSKDTNQVWPQMQVLADNEQAPFLASTSKGLKYRKNGEDVYFTRDALDKRLHPEKRKPPAERR